MFPICPLVVSNKAKEVENRGLWKKLVFVSVENNLKKNMKIRTLDGHKLGQISSYRGLVKCIRCRILISFIWKGSQVARKPS